MSCLVRGCSSLCSFRELSFHTVPKRNPEPWLNALQITDKNWQWNKNRRVCSLHFEQTWFDRTGQTVRLKTGAIPTLNLSLMDDNSDTDSTETVNSEDDMVIEDQCASTSQLENVVYNLSEKQQIPLSAPSTIEPLMPCPSLSFESTKTVSSTSLKSSSSEGTIQRRRKFIAAIHNYSASPGKYKRKFQKTSNELRQCRKKLLSKTKTSKTLRTKVQSLKQVINLLSKKQLISDTASDHLNSSLAEFPTLLFNRLKKRAGKETVSREQFAPALKQFAMTLQFYSAKAYNYVRESLQLALPHPSTIRNWYSGVECDPGFTKGAFDVLALKAQEREKVGLNLICALMLDEISIKKQIQYEGQKTWGYIDVGTDVFDDSLTPASEALVFMVVCHTGAWKLPIAYFLIKSLTGEEKANLIKEALQRLHLVGVTITSVTCDGPSAHFTMMKELGCQISDYKNIIPHFLHPTDGSLVFAVFDVCHMIKLLRSCFATARVIVDPTGGLIQWHFIEKLHKLQASEGLAVSNKLKKSHMDWQKQKMKVRLAVQTLSRSVADALEFLAHDLQLPEFQGVEATIQFIRIADQLFDVLNSRSPFGKGFKAPLRLSTEDKWRPFLNNTLDYLRNCRNLDGRPMCLTNKKTPFVGLIVSTLSIMGMFDMYIKQNNWLKYIFTYKCSQDHLEMFFCSIRSRNGWNNNPSALQLKHAYKRLLYHAEVKGVGGNCVPLDTTTILSINTKQHIKKSDMPGFQVDMSVARKYNLDICSSLDHDYNMVYSPSLSEFVENVVSYISGYVLKMVPKYIKCAECVEALYGQIGVC